MITLNDTSARTITPVGICPIAKLATLTISSMMFIGFASWPLATCHSVGGGSAAISFGPYCPSRRCNLVGIEAGIGGHPKSLSTTSCVDSAYQSCSPVVCSVIAISGSPSRSCGSRAAPA